MNCARRPCTDAISEQLVHEKNRKKNRLFAFQGCKCVIAGRDSFKGCTKCLAANGCVCVCARVCYDLTYAVTQQDGQQDGQSDRAESRTPESKTNACINVYSIKIKYVHIHFHR